MIGEAVEKGGLSACALGESDKWWGDRSKLGTTLDGRVANASFEFTRQPHQRERALLVLRVDPAL